MKSVTNMTRKPNKSVADGELPLLAELPVEEGTLLSELELGKLDVDDMEVYGRCSSREEYNQS